MVMFDIVDELSSIKGDTLSKALEFNAICGEATNKKQKTMFIGASYDYIEKAITEIDALMQRITTAEKAEKNSLDGQTDGQTVSA